jgi:aconitate hydratase
MGATVAAKLIESHLVEGDARAGHEVAIQVDQTLTQDATGTLVMMELEALGLDRVKTEVSVQVHGCTKGGLIPWLRARLQT